MFVCLNLFLEKKRTDGNRNINWLLQSLYSVVPRWLLWGRGERGRGKGGKGKKKLVAS